MNYPNFDPENKSLLKKYLTREVFDKLNKKTTALGYTLTQAINSGLVNSDSNIGVYAGDEESYRLFSELFDPIIEDYHSFKRNDHHHSNLSLEELDINNPDPDGQYILSTRIRVGRNLKNIALGSLISKNERNLVEKNIISALYSLKGDLSGKYHSLNNMSESVRNKMINNHFLFKQGDRFLDAAGLNRNWPEGRGIFYNKAKNFLVWVNEEDHMRIISMQKGADIKKVFSRLINALNQLNNNLEFEYNNRLGYISSCPTNLGTAMRASVHISLPKLSINKQKLIKIIRDHNLQLRGIHGEHSESEGAIFDISNQRRLGITEIEAIKDLYYGVIELIETEKLLA